MTTGHRYRQHSSGRVKIAVALLGALLALLVVASQAPAAVKDGRTIEAFLGTNLIGLYGYPTTGEQVKLEVIRNGVIIATATKTPDADGFIEINHGGAAAGDCFDEPVTPDIIAGDTLKTTVLDSAGNPTDDVDFDVVREVEVNFEGIATDVNAGTITVSGHATSTAEAPIVAGTDALELRLNKGSADTWDVFPDGDQERDGRKDLRVDIGDKVQPDGSWTRTLNVGQQDAQDWAENPGEVFLEWSAAAVGEEALPPSIFVADEAEAEELVDCPPLAEYAVTNSDPQAINATNIGGELVLSGVSHNASSVSVSLDDENPDTPALTQTATPDPGTGAQTWTVTFQATGVAGLSDGKLTAVGAYTVSDGNGGTAQIDGVNLTISKDTSTSTTLETSSVKLDFRQSATLSGKLRASGGEALSGKEVILLRRPIGEKKFSRVPGGLVKTNDQGNFSKQVRPEKNTIYRARFAGVAEGPKPSISAPSRVNVRARVTLNTPNKNLKLGQKRAISGLVAPNHRGSSVRVVIRRGGKVVLNRNVRLNRISRYRFVYKPPRPGVYVVRAVFKRDADHLGNVSPVQKFRVKR